MVESGCYAAFATISISSLTVLYLRLYFLPRQQSLPPRDPPLDVQRKQIVYECLSPAEVVAVAAARKALDSETSASAGDAGDDVRSGPDVFNAEEDGRRNSTGIVNRCYKDTCAGRWKPARARHCSLCKTCRAGFDHHCAIFANCLTVPYIPTFLCLLVSTPPTISLLGAPILLPILRRGREAWQVACSDSSVAGWWEWPLSWVIAGGPMGRWVGGLVLGWRILDREDGQSVAQLRNAALLFLGGVISVICMALAATTITLIRQGQLTIDRERSRSHIRALHAISVLQKKGKPVSSELINNMERYADTCWFFIPINDHPGGGVVVRSLPTERPYDLGTRQNWELIMGKGWGWLLPWQALRRGMSLEKVYNWPVNYEVRERLQEEADRMSNTENPAIN